jgi:hypothetical protein
MAEQLQDRLEALAAAYREAARPPGPSSARRRGRRRRRYQLGAAGLLAVALIAAGVTLGSQLLRGPRPSTVAPATSPGSSDPALEAIPPANDRQGIERTGPIVLVAQGGTSRSTWKLATYPSGKRTCSVVIRDGNAVEYGCGFDVPRRRPVMSSWTTATAASADSAFVHGQVVEQAARIRIEFPNRSPIELPASSQHRSGFQVRAPPRSSRSTSTAPNSAARTSGSRPRSNQADGRGRCCRAERAEATDGSRRHKPRWDPPCQITLETDH